MITVDDVVQEGEGPGPESLLKSHISFSGKQSPYSYFWLSELNTRKRPYLGQMVKIKKKSHFALFKAKKAK